MSKNEKTHHLPLEATLLAHDLLRHKCVKIASIRVKTIGKLREKKRPKDDKLLFPIRRLYERTGQNFEAALEAYNEKHGE